MRYAYTTSYRESFPEKYYLIATISGLSCLQIYRGAARPLAGMRRTAKKPEWDTENREWTQGGGASKNHSFMA
jgi:hypothetical protein